MPGVSTSSCAKDARNDAHAGNHEPSEAVVRHNAEPPFCEERGLFTLRAFTECGCAHRKREPGSRVSCSGFGGNNGLKGESRGTGSSRCNSRQSWHSTDRQLHFASLGEDCAGSLGGARPGFRDKSSVCG